MTRRPATSRKSDQYRSHQCAGGKDEIERLAKEYGKLKERWVFVVS
jgi:hypothetical protein